MNGYGGFLSHRSIPTNHPGTGLCPLMETPMEGYHCFNPQLLFHGSGPGVFDDQDGDGMTANPKTQHESSLTGGCQKKIWNLPHGEIIGLGYTRT